MMGMSCEKRGNRTLVTESLLMVDSLSYWVPFKGEVSKKEEKVEEKDKD
jgi:hypothetical protein